jgi:hypothetical protein
MAAKKKCPKCGAGNETEAVACSLCGQTLGRMTAEAFELEPRQWMGSSQRRRGEKTEDRAVARPESAAPAAEPGGPTGDGHFLLPPVGPPLKLEPSVSTFVFGRDDHCSVKITSAKVSRRHAELRWKGTPPQLVLRDLNSQNGTYLNDEKVSEETALADGDTIRMGDYIASYRFVEPGDDIAHLKPTDTAVMETVVAYADMTPTEDGSALTGDAAILPIHELLRRLLSIHAHGTLSVDVQGTKGSMKIVDGRAVEGTYAGLDGSVAVQAMASLTKGRFRFEPDPNAPPLQANPQTTRLAPPNVDGGTPPPARSVAPKTQAPRPAGPPPAKPGAPPGAGRPTPPGSPAPRPGPRPPSPAD